MVIAQDQHAWAVGILCQQIREALGESRAVRPMARNRKGIPVGRKTCGLCPVGSVQIGQSDRRWARLQMRKHSNRFGVKWQFLCRISGDQPGIDAVAQILQQEKAVGQIVCKDARRREVQPKQMPRNGDEISRVVAATGRGIHQHGAPFRHHKALVTAVRCITCQRGSMRVGPAGAAQEGQFAVVAGHE